MRVLLVTLHLLIIGFLSAISWDEPTVRQEIPAAMAVNGVSVIKVKINKSDIEGFAKLEIAVPQGFAARAIETKGASFTFSDQKMRFVWMTLPDVDHFDITYQLVKMSGSADLTKLQGVFSFIQNNKKKDIAIDNQIINGQVMIDNEGTVDVIDQTFQSFLNVNNDLPVCERTITKKGDEFVVELVLHLNGMKGFLKMQEWTSNGCVLSKFQSAGATVTVDGSSIKFVWFEVPEAETVVVKYKVQCASIPEDGLTIDGKLSFTVDNQPKEVPITLAKSTPTNEVSPKIETENKEISPAVTQAETKIETEQKQVVQNNSAVVNSEKKELVQVKEEKEVVKTDENLSPKKTIPSKTVKQSQVAFKVQVLANHRSVSENEWRNKFGLEEEKQLSNHEGWMKWTVGNFSDYKDARGKRESLIAKCPNLPGPFVTAYQDGNRITVQEALMITQQKWVQ
jgi:hypothetical protein